MRETIHGFRTRSNHDDDRGEASPKKIVIVGGGVASMAAGIELRERMPNCRVELITDAEPDHFGGQVASWDEHGYPIEHGLHALFGFYDEILPLLERIGALDNFTPAQNTSTSTSVGACIASAPRRGSRRTQVSPCAKNSGWHAAFRR
jgi:uncharacterized protein with NAD-binding domain and iron-sulfur cluster